MADTKAVCFGKLVFKDYYSFKGHNALNLIDKDGHLYQWTVFLGNNNTGKTSLLRAIAYLEAIPDISLSKTLPHTYIPLSYQEKPNQENDNKDTLIGADIYEIEKNEKENKIEDFFLNKMLTKNSSLENIFWWYRAYQWRVEQNDNLQNLKIFGYGVNRRTGNTGISDNKEVANSVTLFNSEYKLTNIDEWLFQLDYASKNGQSAATERLQLLKEVIKSDILPEILDFKFTTSDDLKNYIEYQTKEGWFLFEQLGYGYQATMAWIIDLCKKMFERYPTSPNPLKEPAIVLVDELDLHLHPKWQKTIVSYLSKTFAGTQFIVTTHSPLILQTIEKVNLFALIKAEDRVNIRHIPTESLEGWSVEEILRDIMEMDEGVYSDKYNELYKEFDGALDNEDYESAKSASEQLMEILHPDSPERKILKLQLSQIAPVNDKA